jgi:Sec-independent protein translocase protein TatA
MHNQPMIVATLTPGYIGIAVVLVLIYFNRKKIPALGKSLGQTLRQGKKSFDDRQERLDKADEIEATVVSEEDVTRARQQRRERDEV